MDITESLQTQALSMELVDGSSRRTVVINRFPFVIGRSSECNLALPQSYVSRSHATITHDGAQFVLQDTSSRHGTFVNGEQVTRRTLQPGDRIQFGSHDAPQLRLASEDRHTATGPNILSQLQGISAKHSDLEKLRWFLEAARELNSAGQVDRVLASLLETTLALAKVERGYVFLTGANGALEMALGRDATGKRADRRSHSIAHGDASGDPRHGPVHRDGYIDRGGRGSGEHRRPQHSHHHLHSAAENQADAPWRERRRYRRPPGIRGAVSRKPLSAWRPLRR